MAHLPLQLSTMLGSLASCHEPVPQHLGSRPSTPKVGQCKKKMKKKWKSVENMFLGLEFWIMSVWGEKIESSYPRHCGMKEELEEHHSAATRTKAILSLLGLTYFKKIYIYIYIIYINVHSISYPPGRCSGSRPILASPVANGFLVAWQELGDGVWYSMLFRYPPGYLFDPICLLYLPWLCIWSAR